MALTSAAAVCHERQTAAKSLKANFEKIEE